MRYLWVIGLLISSQAAMAVDIFGTDYYLRDSFTRVVDDERGTSIVLMTDDFFEQDTTDVLNINQYPELEKVAKIVNRNGGVALSITGHTDNIYPQEVRYQISEARARRIANYLVDFGVDPDRIHEVSGEGDLWPVAPNDSLERRHLNRRVEITFLREPPATLHFVEKVPKPVKKQKVQEKEVIKVVIKEKPPVKAVKKTTTHIEVDTKEKHSQKKTTSVIVHEQN